jgi:8-oxo-dGTP pyrophosphatase MutT (NUDIX family)
MSILRVLLWQDRKKPCTRNMIASREELIRALENYASVYDEELAFRTHFLELLAEPSCFQRDHLPGHITGSAFIVDERKQFTALTHHAKLNKWLQPGGHADGDENIFRVALREAAEETGLKNFVFPFSGIFDIDIHTIPARKDFPEHLHYDIRLLIQASPQEAFVISEESHDLAWVELSKISELTNNESILRMVRKLL